MVEEASVIDLSALWLMLIKERVSASQPMPNGETLVVKKIGESSEKKTYDF